MKNKRLTLALILALIPLGSVYATLIPSSRVTTWSPGVTVGVVNGIPSNRTNLIDVTHAPYNADPTGAVDAHDAIVAAIAAAGVGDVVYLPAGQYLLNEGVDVLSGKSDFSIRGTGDTTVIHWNGTNGAAFYLGSSSDYQWNFPSGGVAITGGLSQGSTVLAVASTSNVIDGGMIQIAENNDVTLPVIHVSGYQNQRIQKTRIVSHTASTVTISPSLYWTLKSTLNPVIAIAQAQASNIGIEDLMIDASGGSAPESILLEQCYNSWIYNVHSKLSSNYHVYLYDCLQCQVDHCYFDQLNHSGTNGSGLLMDASAACLIQNNIIYKTAPNMEINFGCSGNVFAYNFCYDCTTYGVVGPGIDSNHGPHNSYNLYEGNISANIQADGFFGSASEDTVFRNWLNGTSPGVPTAREAILLNRFTRNYNVVGNLLGTAGVPFVSLDGNPAPEGPYSFGLPNLGNTGFIGTVQPSLGTFWADQTIVGSLSTRTSGTAGVITTTGGTGDLSTSSSQVSVSWVGGQQTSTVIASVSGNTVSFSSSGGTSLPAAGTQMQIWAGPGGYQEKDLDVQASSVLKGNYDVVHQSTPTADQALAGDTLPSSFYLASKPQWFGANQTWPAFDPASPNPDVVSGAVANGYPVAFTSIPAGYRFVNGTDPQIAPYFQAQPSNAMVAAAGNATIVAAAAGYPVPALQWQVSSNAGAIWTNLTNSAPYSNVATSSLTITSASANLNNSLYRCVATNSVGTPATSNSATLMVQGPPAFTTQPALQSVASGSTVAFTVVANGAPAPTFQWQKNGIDLADGGDVSGSATASLTLTGVTSANAGAYGVIATNSLGSTTSTAAALTVTTTSAPLISTQPVSQSVGTNVNVSFTVGSTGAPAPTLQWQVSKDAAATWTNVSNTSPYSNSTTATLTVSGTSVGMNGYEFRCVATNGVGTAATSTAAALSVAVPTAAPAFMTGPASQSVTIGSNVSFATAVSGTPAPTFQWKLNGTSLTNGGVVSGATTSTLVLTAVTTSYHGNYTVVATNGIGTPATSSAAVLTVTSGSSLPVVVTAPAAPTSTVTPTAPTVTTPPTTPVVTAPTAPVVITTPTAPKVTAPSAPVVTGTAPKVTTTPTAPAVTITVPATNSSPSTATTTSGNAGGTVSIAVPSRLANISVRATAGPGIATLITGFVVDGGSKSLLLRGIGTGLSAFGVSGTLTNPSLSLFDSGGIILQSDDGWNDSSALKAAFDSAGAFQLSATGNDSAFVANVTPGSYTAQVTGSDTGVALAEIYDMDGSNAPAGRLVNISARAQVGPAGNAVIAGFVVSGNTSEQVLIRAVGPGLSGFGVQGVLAQPQLNLYGANGNLVRSNIGWGGTAALNAAFSETGAFALSGTSADSALVASLQPGQYTAVVSGANGSTGVVLVEIYEVP